MQPTNKPTHTGILAHSWSPGSPEPKTACFLPADPFDRARELWAYVDGGHLTIEQARQVWTVCPGWTGPRPLHE